MSYTTYAKRAESAQEIAGHSAPGLYGYDTGLALYQDAAGYFAKYWGFRWTTHSCGGSDVDWLRVADETIADAICEALDRHDVAEARGLCL